tara:strand:+ start:713 stop:1141 length:429 start_codon:yes stop_codon:yes gene_type:complete
MAKVSRSMLKGIVKECLVELLAEGLSGGDTRELNESISNNAVSFKNSVKRTQKPAAKKVVNESFEENTRKVISNTTSDPVMASLLEDTAKTTLQEQNSADSSNRFAAKATDSYSRAVDSSDPVELFGEASNNWAALAFSDNK